MAKIDTETKKQIIFLVSIMPLVWVDSYERHIMTKAELDEMGYVGAEDLGDGTYLYKYPVRMARNHVRHMIKAYRRAGVKGIGDYIDSVKALKDLKEAV